MYFLSEGRQNLIFPAIGFMGTIAMLLPAFKSQIVVITMGIGYAPWVLQFSAGWLCLLVGTLLQYHHKFKELSLMLQYIGSLVVGFNLAAFGFILGFVIPSNISSLYMALVISTAIYYFDLWWNVQKALNLTKIQPSDRE